MAVSVLRRTCRSRVQASAGMAAGPWGGVECAAMAPNIMARGGRGRNARSPHRCGDGAQARRRLGAWFRTPLGRRVLAAEQRELAAVLPYLFGFHILQIGETAGADLLRDSRIHHRVVLDESGGGAVGLHSAPEALPVGSESVDVVVLPHVLEFRDSPHQVLREAERCLVPEGHVVILGFNPWSQWGARRWFAGREAGPPWCGHFYSTTRVRDWLSLLGFDTVLVQSFFFRPPLQGDGVMERLAWADRLGERWWPGIGGAYIVVAKKRVVTLTPIRPRWRPRLGLRKGRAGAPVPGA